MPFQLFILVTNFKEILQDTVINSFMIIVSFIIEMLISCIFLELIVLNFCGLNKNIKTNIQNRAIEDKNLPFSKTDDIYEVDGYLVHENDGKDEIEDKNKIEIAKIN